MTDESRERVSETLAAISADGAWIWDGSRWSARHARLRGHVAELIVGWSVVLLFAFPVTFIAAALAWGFGRTISDDFATIAALLAVLLVELCLSAVVVLSTTVVEIDSGYLHIHLVCGLTRYRGLVANVIYVQLHRGSPGCLWPFGGSSVDIFFSDRPPMLLGWEAFSKQAKRMAAILGVPLYVVASHP